MKGLRLLHVADFHLDTAFPGLARFTPTMAATMQQATFTALTRFVALCKELRPDAVLFAGDTYNQEDMSLAAQIALRDALEEIAVIAPVFVVHGNHDPFSSRLQSLHWPENVKVFGAEKEEAPLYNAEGELLALIHGQSHASAKETRNIAAGFKRNPSYDCPQIGLLHADVGGRDGGLYAPCAVEDLVRSGLDYWALGHIHERAIVCEKPLAAYAGTPQGLDITEQGPKGALSVFFPLSETTTKLLPIPLAEFYPLASAEWRYVDIDLENPPSGSPSPESLLTLESLIRKELRRLGENAAAHCNYILARVRLYGRSPLSAALGRLSVRNSLCEALQEEELAPEKGAAVWLKDIEIYTRPPFDREQALQREDLVGEVLREADTWLTGLQAENSEVYAMLEKSLQEVFSGSRKHAGLRIPEQTDLAEFVREAEKILVDYLEKDPS